VTIDAILRDALAPRERLPLTDLREAAREAAADPTPSSIARAVRAGARADRLGYAFVGGYFAALGALDPASRARPTCLAATEVAGVHPRSIETTLVDRPGVGLSLRGQKTFVTLATDAERMIVIARRDEGEPAGPKRALVAVRVPTDRAGVRIEARPPTVFAPEVPHARVLLEDVEVDPSEVLEGHGWDDWLRPFRTVEDAHVLASLVGYVLAVAREAGSADRVAAEAAVGLGALLAIEGDWRSSGSHVTLDGAFGVVRRAFAATLEAMPAAMATEKRRLERDAPLLLVAEGARQKRIAAALERIGAKAG
jgi:alkylation response protein AidB-like acyl-CoA dehydrogenase